MPTAQISFGPCGSEKGDGEALAESYLIELLKNGQLHGEYILGRKDGLLTAFVCLAAHDALSEHFHSKLGKRELSSLAGFFGARPDHTIFEPAVKRKWLAPGIHLNVVGTHTPANWEVDAASMATARVFVDQRESTLTKRGALLATKHVAFVPEYIWTELGEVLTGTRQEHASAGEITLFKSLGVLVEGLALEEYLYRRALENRLGDGAFLLDSGSGSGGPITR